MTATDGKVYKRDIREKLYMLGGMVGKEHTVVIPVQIDVKLPAGKTAKFSYDVYLANIDRIRGMGDEQVLKKSRIGGGTFDATGDTMHGAIPAQGGIKDLFDGAAGGPPPGVAASNRYGVMVVVRQLTADGTKYYPDSQAYKSIFMTKTDPAPALSSDNAVLKP